MITNVDPCLWPVIERDYGRPVSCGCHVDTVTRHVRPGHVQQYCHCDRPVPVPGGSCDKCGYQLRPAVIW